MKKKYTIIPAFSKVFYQSQLDNNKNDLHNIIDHIEKYEYSSSIGYYVKNHKENENNYNFTSKNKFILENTFFKNLKNQIMNEFNFFKNTILNYNNITFKMTTSWISKTKKNQISFPHNHHNCMFSGIYYLKTASNTGGLSFENFNDVRYKIEPTNYNIYNAREFTFNVEDNSIIFFPSECHHKILNHNSDIIRYSIAFNFIPIGKIGIEGEDSYYEINE